MGLLLAAKVDAQATDVLGRKALYFAAGPCNAALIRFLCKRNIGGGINERARALGDRLPLHTVASNERGAEAARALIDFAADVKARDMVQ